jgi:hypothetical protein
MSAFIRVNMMIMISKTEMTGDILMGCMVVWSYGLMVLRVLWFLWSENM